MRSFGDFIPGLFSNLLLITRLFCGGFRSHQRAKQHPGQREFEFIAVCAAQDL